jgi:hypothetical protein
MFAQNVVGSRSIFLTRDEHGAPTAINSLYATHVTRVTCDVDFRQCIGKRFVPAEFAQSVAHYDFHATELRFFESGA